MATITIDIDNMAEARKFLHLAKNLKFVKKAIISNDNDKPLTDEDWIKSGRPATDKELEERLAKIDSEILNDKLFSFEDVKNEVSSFIINSVAV